MSRLSRLQEWMQSEGLDGFLTCDGINRRYLTRFSSSAGWAAVTLKDMTFFCDSRYTIAAEAQAKGYGVVEIKNFFDAIALWAEENKLGRIGIEASRLTLSTYNALKEKLGKERLVAVEDPIAQLRMVKEKEEINSLACAAELADEAWAELLREPWQGRSEKALAWRLEQLLREKGAERLSFETIVASGVNGACPHAEPGDRLIQKGDLVTVDFGCVVDGYCSDMTRTVAVGNPNDEAVYWYESVLKAQTKAVEAVRAGASAKEIDALSRMLLKEADLDQYFGHSLGHGVGLEIHELPTLSPKSDTILKEGMVVTVEPGVYLPQKGGVRIEDTVVVTADGCRLLTRSPKVLTIL